MDSDAYEFSIFSSLTPNVEGQNIFDLSLLNNNISSTDGNSSNNIQQQHSSLPKSSTDFNNKSLSLDINLEEDWASRYNWPIKTSMEMLTPDEELEFILGSSGLDELAEFNMSRHQSSSDVCKSPSIDTSCSSSSSSRKRNMNINFDPVKRSKSDPGLSLNLLINKGVNLESLEPHVLKRLKNTDSARRSRAKRQTILKEMEVKLEEQRKEMAHLVQIIHHLKYDLNILKSGEDLNNMKLLKLLSWIRRQGISIPIDLDIFS